MLTSFFGKSNPVNYLILGGFIVAGYLLGTVLHTEIYLTPYVFFNHAAFILVSLLNMFLLDFIIRKNNLTQNNTYAIFFFTGFLTMLPVIFLQHKIILANLFLLLALRRLMSLRSDKNSEKKILDASVWISVATLFYFWSLLLFVPLWLAIAQKPNSNYKQMLVPITGFLAVGTIHTAYQLLANDTLLWFLGGKIAVGLDFSAYNAAAILVPVTIILAFYIWAVLHRMFKISKVSLKERPNLVLLMVVSVTTLFIALGAPEKTGAELLFVLAPFAILSANYIESPEKEHYREKDMTEFWFKEIMLWLLVILPFVFLFL